MLDEEAGGSSRHNQRPKVGELGVMASLAVVCTRVAHFLWEAWVDLLCRGLEYRLSQCTVLHANDING
jgi:hypothetical protein